MCPYRLSVTEVINACWGWMGQRHDSAHQPCSLYIHSLPLGYLNWDKIFGKLYSYVWSAIHNKRLLCQAKCNKWKKKKIENWPYSCAVQFPLFPMGLMAGETCYELYSWFLVLEVCLIICCYTVLNKLKMDIWTFMHSRLICSSNGSLRSC